MNVTFSGVCLFFQDQTSCDTFAESSDECPDSIKCCEMMPVSRGKVLFANLFCSWSSVAVCLHTVVPSALNRDNKTRAERHPRCILFISQVITPGVTLHMC